MNLPQTIKAHRPDIDGLRTVAVLLVVLFHLGVPHLNGGFIGVDIFFAISGYLITGTIARQIAQDKFSLGGFYERRIRRIIPALLVVLVVCSLACTFVFLPADLMEYGRSLLAAVFSYSNFYFFTQSGYFKETYVKVLLHTWSLAVEEQFYVVLPVTLMLLRRRQGWVRPVLLGMTAVSFAVSAWLAKTNPQAAFFMPYSRAWELLAGSVVALGMVQLPRSRAARQAMAVVGMLMIAFAALRYTAATPFPGVAALLPCVGTVLLLVTGEGEATLVAAVLSTRPMVFIGTISYSVYLWHWPLILFVRMGVVPGLSSRGAWPGAATLACSLALGWLSWRFVEQPFRVGVRGRKMSRRALFSWAGASAAALSAAAVFLIASAGLPSRFPSQAVRLAGYMDEKEEMRIGDCFISSGNRFSDYKADVCAGRSASRRNYLLIGDSHAAALWFGLQQKMKDVNVMQATASGCRPLVDQYDESNCGRMRRFLFESYLPAHPVDGVILTERWMTREDVQGIEPTVLWLKRHGIPVVVVGPVQEYDVPLPMLLAFAVRSREPGLPERHAVRSYEDLDRQLAARAAAWQVAYLSPWRELCASGHCREYADDGGEVPMLADSNHLTNRGAMLLAQAWVKEGVLR